MEKVLKNRHRSLKIVNNLNIKNHIYSVEKHNLNKDILSVYSELSKIYAELDSDFQKIDVVDLDFYERWLNERY